ncbi:MAG: class I SAM-dependent methyltransferase [Planctomycetaceae bacterium]
MSWFMMWRVVRGRREAAHAAAENRDAGERFAASLDAARISQTWFLRHVPMWLAIFKRQGLAGRRGIRVLEVGSWEGLSCRFVLDQLAGSVITCVDTWEGADEHVGRADALDELEARFDHNTRRYGDRVVKWKGTSQAYFAACTPRECFDLVYIDGSHRADDVLVDAVLGFEALAVGGVMILDDYLWKYYDRPGDNPGAAINAFLRLKQGSYDLIHAGSQVVIAKTQHQADMPRAISGAK